MRIGARGARPRTAGIVERARAPWASACWRRPSVPPRHSPVTRLRGPWSRAPPSSRGRPRRRGLWPATAADPAPRRLKRSDVYVSPRALGAGAADARLRLERGRRRLAAQGRPVKLAVVAGPAGARSMLVYARRLAKDVGGGETLVVTAPGRGVAAVGPLSPAETTRLLRAARVGAVTDPVERAIGRERGRRRERSRPTRTRATHGLVLLALAAPRSGLGRGRGLRRRRAARSREAMLERRAAAGSAWTHSSARAAALAGRTDRRSPVPALGARPGPSARCDEILAALPRADDMGPGGRASTSAFARAWPPSTRRLRRWASTNPPTTRSPASARTTPPTGRPSPRPASTARPTRPRSAPPAPTRPPPGRPLRPRLIPIGGRPAPYTEVHPDRPEEP